jgi:hypothetical protein
MSSPREVTLTVTREDVDAALHNAARFPNPKRVLTTWESLRKRWGRLWRTSSMPEILSRSFLIDRLYERARREISENGKHEWMALPPQEDWQDKINEHLALEFEDYAYVDERNWRSYREGVYSLVGRSFYCCFLR